MRTSSSTSLVTQFVPDVPWWHLHLKSDKTIEDLGRMFHAEIRGWLNCYCRFCPSAFRPIAKHLDLVLARWAIQKYKRLRGHRRRAIHWIGRVSKDRPGLFGCSHTGKWASFSRLEQWEPDELRGSRLVLREPGV